MKPDRYGYWNSSEIKMAALVGEIEQIDRFRPNNFYVYQIPNFADVNEL